MNEKIKPKDFNLHNYGERSGMNTSTAKAISDNFLGEGFHGSCCKGGKHEYVHHCPADLSKKEYYECNKCGVRR